MHTTRTIQCDDTCDKKKLLIISRCAWTLYNFRLNLIKKAMEQGFQVICAGSTTGKFEKYAKLLEEHGIHLVNLPIDKSKGVLKNFRLLGAIWDVIAREQPDVMHLFTIKPVILGGIIANIMRDTRTIVTITGLGHTFITASRATRFLVRIAYRVSLLNAKIVFFQNREDKALFLESSLVSEKRSRIVNGSGVDLEYFKPQSVTLRPNNCIVFLFVGRLIREKGIYEFIEASVRLLNEVSNVKVRLLGDRDELNPSVVTRSDLDVWQDKYGIEWAGYVVDVRPHIAKADVVVLPSYREGTPRSLLEAAAMAKPIITSDAVGCRNVIDAGRNGYKVPVKDVTKLYEAMVRFVKNPQIIGTMGKHSRDFVQRQYDEKDVLKAYLKSYAK